MSRGYFAAIGIPVSQGRAFDAGDTASANGVAIVNRAFARRYFPDGQALGRHIRVHAADRPPSEIVGVVGDIRHGGLTTAAGADRRICCTRRTPGTSRPWSSGRPASPRASPDRSRRQSGTRSNAGRVGREDDGAVCRRPARPAAPLRRDGRVVRDAGAAARRGRRLRADGVRRHPAHARVRDSHGARRRTGAVFRSVFGYGTTLTVTGLVIGFALALALAEGAVDAAVRGHGQRSRHLSCRGRNLRGARPGRDAGSRVARVPREPDHRSPVRLSPGTGDRPQTADSAPSARARQSVICAITACVRRWSDARRIRRQRGRPRRTPRSSCD